MKHRVTIGALAVSFTLTAAGCGAFSSSGSTESARAAEGCADLPDVTFESLENGLPVGVDEPQSADFTIAYANGLDIAEPLHIEGVAAKQETERLGGTFVTEDAAGDPDLQLTQILRFIDQDVDAIMVSVLDPGALRPALDRAESAGIPVLGVEVDLASTEPADGWLAQIWPGRDRLTYLQAQTAAELLPCDASFVSMELAVRIPTVEFAVEREAHWAEQFGLTRSGLATAPSADITGGETAMAELLARYADADGAIIWTDAVADGARSAARSAGNSDMLIVGGNGGNDGIESVRAGRIDATVQLDYPEVGRQAVWALYGALQGSEIPRTFLVTEPLVVNQGNIDEVSTWNEQIEANRDAGE